MRRRLVVEGVALQDRVHEDGVLLADEAADLAGGGERVGHVATLDAPVEDAGVEAGVVLLLVVAGHG